jgi:DNA polymerase-4
MLLARYPDELGPIRLVGVGFSGLEVARQDVLFPELDLKVRRVEKEKDDDFEVGVRSVSSKESTEEHTEDPLATMTTYQGRFRVTQDVEHPEFGHGWVQGMGHGKVTVRFETRTTLKSAVKTFDIDDNELTVASPLGSLDWDLSEEEVAYGEASEKK